MSGIGTASSLVNKPTTPTPTPVSTPRINSEPTPTPARPTTSSIPQPPQQSSFLVVTSKVSSIDPPKPTTTSVSPNAPTPPGPVPTPTTSEIVSSKAEVKPGRSSDAISSAPYSAPELSLVPVVPATSTSDGSVIASTTSSSRIPLARWNGNGALLNGYCASTAYTIIDGPTAYWAPVVGCMGSRADCCPFDIAPSTTALAGRAAETDASDLRRRDNGNGGFPNALSPAQATLTKCPDDYHNVGSGCCPSNYFPWTTAFGGQTPCYSAVSAAVTPPPVSGNVAANPAKQTSAIVNVVYAMQYPVRVTDPAPKPGLSTGAIAGIGAGAGGAALIFGVLLFLLFRKHRAHKRDKAALDETSGIGSTRPSVANSSAFGGVNTWQTKVAASEASSGLKAVPEAKLPQGVMHERSVYPADRRQGQRTVSPSVSVSPVPVSPIPVPPVPVPHPGYHHRPSLPSTTIPEGYSEIGSDNGHGTNISELHSGEYGMQRQELSAVQGEQIRYQTQHGGQGGYGERQHQSVAPQVHEAP